jgi:Universal stress protein family
MQSEVRRAILVPLDGSELAERALGPARQLAVATGAPLLLVRVVPDRGVGEMAGASADFERARRYLAGLASYLRAPIGRCCCWPARRRRRRRSVGRRRPGAFARVGLRPSRSGPPSPGVRTHGTAPELVSGCGSRPSTAGLVPWRGASGRGGRGISGVFPDAPASAPGQASPNGRGLATDRSAPTAGGGAMAVLTAARSQARSVPVWEETTAARPCPVCGAGEDCAVDAADPELALCRRRVSALPVLGGRWLHVLSRPTGVDKLRR